jgi:hypothetical protein
MTMIGELVRTWKEADTVYFQALSWHSIASNPTETETGYHPDSSPLLLPLHRRTWYLKCLPK